MIYSVQGKIQEKETHYVVMDIHGLGLKILVSSGTYDKLPEVGVGVRLLTHFQVKEDSMSLYGFLEEKERNLFEALISISGIGPKSALGILSLAPVEHLAAAIARGEKEILQKSYGIGKRTAER
ncbi:MAG: Holliday junction branch migration protein RuvA, partial [bacterium]|nr:Holliday junction branch migration protein RuvA [bacterium]